MTNEEALKRMKAILVIDMPDNCASCPLLLMWVCMPKRQEMGIAMTEIGRPSWCPLKPMPTKKVPIFDANNFDKEEEEKILWEINGYNRCIDEITGEVDYENS